MGEFASYVCVDFGTPYGEFMEELFSGKRFYLCRTRHEVITSHSQYRALETLARTLYHQIV